MSLAAFAAVVAAGVAGAVARAWTSWAVARLVGRPGAGTLAVNLIGAFLAGAVGGGLLNGSAAPSELETVAAVGFLGAFTTFSTWMVDLLDRWRTGARVWAATGAIATLVLGMALAALGAWLAG